MCGFCQNAGERQNVGRSMYEMSDWLIKLKKIRQHYSVQKENSNQIKDISSNSTL